MWWPVMIPVVALVVFVAAAMWIMRLQKAINRTVGGDERAAHVLRVGLATTAEVLSTADTGVRLNRLFILTQLRLRVAAVGDIPAYETQVKAPISPVKLAEFAPGRVVSVRVEPSTREVALDQPLR